MQRPDAVAATWYDGKSAVERHVTVRYREYNGELRICPPDGINDVTPLAVWQADAIRRISGHVSPLTLKLEPDDGQRLIITAPAAIKSVKAWLAPSTARHKKNRLRRWLIGTAAAWAFFAVLLMGSSAIFSFAAGVIPLSWEESLGRSARENLVGLLKRMPGSGTRGICRDGTQSPDLKMLVERLQRSADDRGFTFDLLVLDADFVNAFALPGGYMAVSTGLIRHCGSADELAGVIAHEMAHVTERHGTASILRGHVWDAFLSMMGIGSNTAGSLAQYVMSSAFSRDDERTADARGVERLIAAGVDPMAMADFFGKLSAEEGEDASWLDYISSHPALGERRESIRRQAGKYAAERDGGEIAYTPAMSPEAWARLRTVCPKKTEDATEE